MTVGAPTSTTDRYLGACRSFLCGMVFLRSPARLSASHLQIHLFIDSNVALGTLLRGTSRQSYWNDLDTDIWFEAAAQSSAAPHMTIPSKINLADA